MNWEDGQQTRDSAQNNGAHATVTYHKAGGEKTVIFPAVREKGPERPRNPAPPRPSLPGTKERQEKAASGVPTAAPASSSAAPLPRGTFGLGFLSIAMEAPLLRVLWR